MTIADSRSVLLLGAGVSEPFGMPLGGQLVSRIARQIGKELRAAEIEDSYGQKAIATHRIQDWASYAAAWHDYPIHGTVVAADGTGRFTPAGMTAARTQLQDLLALLQNQTAETIDAFIAENPKVAPLTKMAVAAMMLKAMYTTTHDNKHNLILRQLDARELDVGHRGGEPNRRERNWIHLLINIVRHAIDENQVSPTNKVKIISFNYDTILEHVLERQFSNRETRLAHYSEYFEIHHVHGKFGEIAGDLNQPWKTALSWSKQICVVKESKPTEEVSTARARAEHLIANAENIYTVGFSFAGPNCRLIKLTDGRSLGGRILTFCNYDGNRGITEAAKRYVVSHQRHREVAGSDERPMGVSDFIKSGYLGEPPG